MAQPLDERPQLFHTPGWLKQKGQGVATGALDGHEVLRRYCTLVYAETSSYSETARRVGVDRKTARLKVDPGWLAALRGTAPVPPDGNGAANPTDERAG